MKQLKKDLQAVLKSLKQATEKTEKLMKKGEKLDKPQASKKPKPRRPRKHPIVTWYWQSSQDPRKELMGLP